MLPATAWDDADWGGSEARGWTVMGQLRRRQALLRDEGAAARRRLEEKAGTLQMMTAVSMAADAEDAIRARWRGGPNVLALLFVHPDAGAIEVLDSRGDYFNRRSGATWDLFVPGYYRSSNPELEAQVGSEPVGRRFAKDWFFSPRDFDSFREHVEQSSDRWNYSGRTDLVLVNGWMPAQGPPTVDWESTLSGSLSEPNAPRTLTLAEVVERITGDLKQGLEDPAYGVGPVVFDPSLGGRLEPIARDLFIGALSGILSSIGTETLGIK